MATVHDQFIAAGDESGYATGVAPTHFFEPAGDSVSGNYERIESEAINGPLLREDRFATNPKGAAGQWTFEVLDHGFDFWLKHMLGTVATTGDGTSTPLVATATLGSLTGKSFSGQAARYASGSDTLIPFAYHGGKVNEWEMSAEVDGILKWALTLDFATEVIDGTGTDALAVPTWVDGAQLLTFIGATVNVGGSPLVVSSVNLTGNNGLKVDRYGMRGASSTTKREPKAEAMQEISFELGAEFEDKTHIDRVAAALASAAVAPIILHFDSPQGGALDVTLPVARFDEGPVSIDRKITEQSLKGKILAPADGSEPITVVYTQPIPA